MSLQDLFKQTRVIAPSIPAKPELLTHPNIPKPLHLVNPRTELGSTWWEKTKAEAKVAAGGYCQACGTHYTKTHGPKWLEAHEEYNYDYPAGRITYVRAVALCHYCHNFIHSGRLQNILGKEKSEESAKNILQHGFWVLSGAGLKSFPNTLNFAKELGVNTFGVRAYKIPDTSVAWADWRMIIFGKEYGPKFKSYEEWANHFGVIVDVDMLLSLDEQEF